MNNKEIVEFLRKTANMIEKEEIDELSLQKAGEYYMKSQIPTTFSEKDAIKYLSIGWYIYNVILQEK